MSWYFGFMVNTNSSMENTTYSFICWLLLDCSYAGPSHCPRTIQCSCYQLWALDRVSVNACVADGTHVWSTVAGRLEPEVEPWDGGVSKGIYLYLCTSTHTSFPINKSPPQFISKCGLGPRWLPREPTLFLVVLSRSAKAGITVPPQLPLQLPITAF